MHTYRRISTPKLPPIHTTARSMVTSVLFQEKSQDQELLTAVNVWSVGPTFVSYS